MKKTCLFLIFYILVFILKFLFGNVDLVSSQVDRSRCIENFQTYYSPVDKAFGSCVVHQPGWDRFVMYLSINSTIKNSQPSKLSPGDSQTYNQKCDTWWADRIWYTWHFGDGIKAGGWDKTDSHGNKPPILALDIGGEGESALIGDPDIVFWQGIWHMYYEGTDQCDGSDNRIFHATSEGLFKPWTKQGQVEGLIGNLKGSGLSWPSTYVEDGNLYLYYTDGSLRLYAAKAVDGSGHKFVMANKGKPVISELVNEGSVSRYKNGYRLIYDLFQRKAVKVSQSVNKFSFLPGKEILLPSDSGWNGAKVGLPFYFDKARFGGEHSRIYYTGQNETPNIGVCILPKEGDLNYDDQVNVVDVKPLLSLYRDLSFETDLNGDGLANGIDFGEMLLLIE